MAMTDDPMTCGRPGPDRSMTCRAGGCRNDPGIPRAVPAWSA